MQRSEPAQVAEFDFSLVDKGYLRDRADLSIVQMGDTQVCGLYDLDRKEIVDMQECKQMSPQLWAAFTDFKAHLPPIKLGSVRIRVGPNQEKGLWLDFSNLDIKKLIDEKNWLLESSKKFSIEIGQKRKTLVFEDGVAKLREGIYGKWFETYYGVDLKPFSLYTKIGSFTQAGFRANRKMVEVLLSFLAGKQMHSALELFCGNGNFTFPLASQVEKVFALEMDALSLESMEKSLQKFEFSVRIKILRKNLHKKDPELFSYIETADVILVDPPRSGMQGSLEILQEAKKLPKYFIYISCFLDSYAQDVKILGDLGYKISKLHVVDQFPQSEHFEIMSLLERDV